MLIDKRQKKTHLREVAGSGKKPYFYASLAGILPLTKLIFLKDI
jgi:hypothetical protein